MSIFHELLSKNMQCQKDMNMGYFQFLIDIPGWKQKENYIERINC